MPIPTPGEDETEDEFISRCMTAIGDEYDDKDQALAICFGKWREVLIEQIEPAIWKIVMEADACDLCLYYQGQKFETAKIWEEFPYAMPLFDKVIEPNIHPNCRCQLILVKGIEMRTESLHRDFIKIQNEFTDYYCKDTEPCDQGTFEFNAWVSDLGLDTSKAYGKSMEAFQWAQDMIAKVKEDENSVHYKVLFAFPTTSMNGNVYTEEEIENSVNSIIGKSPSLNHWEDTRKLFEEGGVKYIGAEYEDGACEAILKVPKDFVCPECGEGKTLTSLIDEKKIVNVSLECTCELVGPGNTCIGLEFDAPTLLTSTTLPGIPMARIFPLEKVFNEALAQRKRGIRMEGFKVEITGLEQELPDGQGQCPEGMIWNDTMGQCVEDKDCPDGQHWDDATGACVPDEAHDPEGTDVKLGVPAADDTSKKPIEGIESMTEDEIKDKIIALQKQIDDFYGETDYSIIEPLYAELRGYQDALAALIKAKVIAVEQECPDGMKWDPETETCVPVSDEQQDCPEGQVWDPDQEKCVPVTTEAMTEDEIKDKILSIQKQIDDFHDSLDKDYALIEPIYAELSAYRDALAELIKAKALAQEKTITLGQTIIIPSVKVEQEECPEDQVWDAEQGKCVPIEPPEAEKAMLELKVSELELENFKARKQFKSAEEEIVYLTEQIKKLIVEKINLTGQLKAALTVGGRRQATIDKRDKALIEKDKDIAEKTMALQKIIIEKEKIISQKDILMGRIGDEHKDTLDKAEERAEITSNARKVYKDQLEALRDDFEVLDGKYNQQLDINLNITKKMTKIQEELLAASKEKDFLNVQLKKAKRLSKIVVTMDNKPKEG